MAKYLNKCQISFELFLFRGQIYLCSFCIILVKKTKKKKNLNKKMTLYLRLKNVTVCIKEDILLLETCLSEMFYLLKSTNDYCKTLYWEKVTYKMSQQTHSMENIGEIKERFDIIYAFYLRIRTTPFFLSKMYKNLNDDERIFFTRMHQCFNKIYYDKNGALNLIKKNISRILLDEEFNTGIYFNDSISYEIVQSSYTNAIFSKRYDSQKNH